MEARNTRAADRFPVKTSVSFRIYDDPQARLFQGLMMDVGFLGICMFTSTLLEIGQRVCVWVLNPQSSDLTKIDGEVAWISLEDTYGDSPYWVKAGISFNELSEAQRGQIFDMFPPEGKKRASSKTRKNILAVLP